ncbi:MAG: PHP domain-containing protein [Oscillospiraceae bacterium]|nr:PHP domain-containing protein [Oscillospiraceae bacterium]
MKKIDLHIHTTASDGTCTPEEVVREAARLGLAAVAITDHDTAEGYLRAAAEGESCGLEVVPGIEISTKFRSAVHILGYYIDVASPALDEVLDWMHRDREERNVKLCAMLRASGVDIDIERMHARFGDLVGRPHFAEIMIENGMARDINDAFERLLNKNMPFFIPRQFLSIERSIEIIREAGGTPVLAHPFQYRLDDAALRELIEHCMASGLEGIECRYTGYDAAQCAYLEALAEEYGLVKTGGSDFHGAHKREIRLGEGGGELCVPYAFLEALKEHRGKT